MAEPTTAAVVALLRRVAGDLEAPGRSTDAAVTIEDAARGGVLHRGAVDDFGSALAVLLRHAGDPRADQFTANLTAYARQRDTGRMVHFAAEPMSGVYRPRCGAVGVSGPLSVTLLAALATCPRCLNGLRAAAAPGRETLHYAPGGDVPLCRESGEGDGWTDDPDAVTCPECATTLDLNRDDEAEGEINV